MADVALPDLSTFWYASIVLLAVGLARAAPWAAEPRVPGSLVRADDAEYASLYAWNAVLILCAYLPAAFGLARRAGGRAAPLTLAAAVIATTVASAPLEAAFRTRHDASAPARRVLAALGLGVWLSSLGRTDQARVVAFAAFVARVLVGPHVRGFALAIESITLTALHLDLALAAESKGRPSAAAWRAAVPLGITPIAVVALTPVLLTLGHAQFEMADRPVNHAGVPLCAFRHAEVLPHTIEAAQDLVRAHASLRPRGGRHSWSSLACPRQGGVVLDTKLLRAVSYDPITQTILTGAGANLGTVTNLAHRHNRMLKANWHHAVTTGGAVASSVSHVGVSISELVTSLDVIYANGSLATVAETDADFPLHFGSVGMLALVVGVTLRTLPRAPLEWTSTTEPYVDNGDALAVRIGTWADGGVELRSSVLWVLPSLRETTLQIATYGAPLAPPANGTWVATPHMPRTGWGDVGLTFSLFNNALALLVGLADPLALGVSEAIAEEGMRAFVAEYTKDAVSAPHLPTTGLVDQDDDKLPTYVASVEMAVVVGRANLEACVRALAAFPVATALHLRYAPLPLAPLSTSGPGTYFVDFSLPEATLHRLAPHLRRADAACPPPTRADGFAAADGHAGKLSLRDVRERRVWSAPAAATLPGRTPSAAHVLFRQRVVALDPLGKFTPNQ
jgi:hypothetical protein